MQNLRWDGYGKHHQHQGKTVSIPGIMVSIPGIMVSPRLLLLALPVIVLSWPEVQARDYEKTIKAIWSEDRRTERRPPRGQDATHAFCQS
jgi:hypothetical protein